MKHWMLILTLAAIGCSDDATNNAGSDSGMSTGDMAGSDTGGSTDMGPSADDGGTHDDMKTPDIGGEPDSGGGDMAGGNGSLPDVRATHGVAYFGHLESTTLRYFRTDGAALEMEGSVDVGSPILALELDRERDLLFATHPFDNEVSIWQLSPPADGASPVDAPVELWRTSFDDDVLATRVDPFGQKLYAAEQLPLPGNGQPQTEMVMHVYDISDPSAPTELTSLNLPASTSWDIDPVRKTMFLAQGSTNQLFGYDLAGESFEALGDPIDLLAWYPEDNMSAFQARSLSVEPFSNRVYIARAQGLLSELIAIEFPATIPNGNARYGEVATMDDLAKIDDAFDLAVEQGNRPDIFGAYQPSIDPLLDMVFMTADAWNGMASTALMVNFRAGDISTLGEGCGDHADGFGCFFRRYNGGTPGSYAYTDGASCVDYTNRVVIGASVDNAQPANAGAIFAYTYDENGGMQPFPNADGDTVDTDAYPASSICH